MLRFIVLLMSLLLEGSMAIIYSINESEYQTMPHLYDLDEYDSCLLETGGVYCVVDVDLFSEEESRLMHLIQGYSEHTMKHFNHTQIHRGVCVTKTCKAFEKINNSRMDLDKTVESCVNDSLWREYRLQGKLNRVRYCKRSDEKITLDTSDVIVGVIYLVLILLNVSGSFYDVLFCNKEDCSSGNPYLQSFSLPRNWVKLTSPNTEGRDPRLSRLKLFHGLRTMTMVCVFFSHTVLMIAYSYVDNPFYIEKSYEDPLKQILFNGSLVTHTFFVMSSFLLAYNFEIYSEKHGTCWKQLPKGILLRWLRLTPAYALVLATISTWMRYLGSGPLWDLVVTSEATACRQYWWAHILYINNYVYDDAHCAPQTWYLAADTQLFCLGLLLCVTVRRTQSRKIALLLMFLLSLLIVAGHTYFQNLEAVVIQTPETYRTLYSHDDTFRLLYIRGHTNMSTYVLGLSGGFIAYYWQNEEKNLEKYKSYRWIIWLLFPLAVAVILSGGLFYADGAPPPTPLRVVYATLYKPVFQLLVVVFIMSTVFKFENVYRGIVEWRGFTWMGRVSYCGFLLHTLFQRGLVGSQRKPLYMSDYDALVFLCATILLSFAGGCALWLFVEAPLTGVVRAAFAPPKKIQNNSKV